MAGEPAEPEAAFFVGTRGQRHRHAAWHRQVHRVFAELREQLGWLNRGTHHAPRIHDLRHTFVVRRIVQWQAAGRRRRSGDAVAVDLRRAREVDQHLLVPFGGAGVDGSRRRSVRVICCTDRRRDMRSAIAPKPPSFASLVQQFFTEYLVAQRAVSPRTVACYRDALTLFLDFASSTLHKAPTDMRLVDLQPDLILAFLDHLEHEPAQRGSQPQPAPHRAARVPEVRRSARRDRRCTCVEQALAVPMKRFEQPMLGFLTARRCWRCSGNRERTGPRSAIICS